MVDLGAGFGPALGPLALPERRVEFVGVGQPVLGLGAGQVVDVVAGGERAAA